MTIHARSTGHASLRSSIAALQPHVVVRLAIDVIDRLPRAGARGKSFKRQLRKKSVQHRQAIYQHDEDKPEIRHWTWEFSTLA